MATDKSFFKRLNKLFSTSIIISKPGKKRKVLDIDKLQIGTGYQTNRLISDRYSGVKGSGMYGYLARTQMVGFQLNKNELYKEYEKMDQDSILASALDIFSDDATVKNEYGDILDIRSPKEEIHDSLRNLFYDILNIEFNLWSWIRSLCKYGDFFLKLDITEEIGVTNVIPLSAYAVFREEDPNNPNLVKFSLDPSMAVNFGYRFQTGTQKVSFENYEMAHFRLITDTNYLPYGRSMLESARRVWKQLCLAGDSRIWTPTGYKEIKDIKTGDIIYSYDYENKNILEAKVKKQSLTGKKELYEIKTSHRTIRATKEHPILLSDGTYKEVKDLTSNDNIIITVREKNHFTKNFNGHKIEKIKSIEYCGIEEVYDIEVDNDLHNFISDGVITHNCLMEDAMLIHRIMRAPEKRVFKIDIGNIPPNEVDTHMNNIINKLKKVPYIDPTTGQYNMEFNLQPVAWYTRIPLLDGRIITIKELAEEQRKGIENWVYSIDKSNNNKIVPGKILECDLTQENADIVRIKVDDNSYADMEPNHPVMLRNGDYVKAKDVQVGDSLMPFYTLISDEKNISGYEKILDPKIQKYEFTHRIVARELNIDNYNNTKNVVHHSNFRKNDNSPNNLNCEMPYYEHTKYHSENASNIWKTKTRNEKDEINKKRSNSHKKNLENGYQVWNKGLTKEIDPRIKTYGEKSSKTSLLQFKNGERIPTFLGKKKPEHSKWMKENYIPYIRTEEHLKKLSESRMGENNPMYGRSWDEIYGIIRSKELRKELSKFASKNMIENNPMKLEKNKKEKSKFMHQENKRRWTNKEYKEKVSKAMKDNFDDYLFNMMKIIIGQNNNLTLNSLVIEMNKVEDLYNYYLELNKGRKKPNKFKYHVLTRAIRNKGYKDYKSFRKIVVNELINHKVISVELLQKKEDVYCMNVDKYHNFALDTHGGEIRNGFFVRNSMLEDFYLPVRGDKSGTEIDTLGGMEFTGIDDIEYLKCLRGNTNIKLLNGQDLSIKEIVESFTPKKYYTWSINPDSLNLEPVEIIGAKKTRKNTELIRVYLDNDTHIDCTPDHNFMLRNGEFKEAQNLNSNDSLMPLYTKLSNKEKNLIDDYEMIYNPGKNRWEYSHRVVGKYKYPSLNKDFVIHHLDFVKLNNKPNNLLAMTLKAHNYFHGLLNKIYKRQEGILNPNHKGFADWEEIVNVAKSVKNMREFRKVFMEKYGNYACAINTIKSKGYDDRSFAFEIIGNKYVYMSEGISVSEIQRRLKIIKNYYLEREEFTDQDHKNIRTKNNLSRYDVVFSLKKLGFESLKDFYVKEIIKIRKIEDLLQISKDKTWKELLNEKGLSKPIIMFIYKKFIGKDLRNGSEIGLVRPPAHNKGKKSLFPIWNKGLYTSRKKFKCIICGKEFEGYGKRAFCSDKCQGIAYSKVYTGSNNFSLIKGCEFIKEGELLNHKVVKIRRLSKKEDTYDIQVSRNSNFALSNGIFIHNSRMLAALKIPKAFLTYDEELTAKATLSMEDARFARTIERIQKIVVSELTKIAIIHLYSQGVEDADLVNFKLELTIPSTTIEKEKTEIWASKVSLARDFKELKLVSDDWIYENIFHMSEEQYEEERKKLVESLKLAFRFGQIEDEGNDPAVTQESIGTKSDNELLAASIQSNNEEVKKKELISKTLAHIQPDKEKKESKTFVGKSISTNIEGLINYLNTRKKRLITETYNNEKEKFSDEGTFLDENNIKETKKSSQKKNNNVSKKKKNQ